MLQPGTNLNHDMDEILYSDFTNKKPILFTVADNICSIPCVANDLKPGQRKAMGMLQAQTEKWDQGKKLLSSCSKPLFHYPLACTTRRVYL